MIGMLIGDKTIAQVKGVFIKELEELFPILMKQYMTSLQHDLDLEKIVITSPVAAAITYSLMDAYRLIVVHEQRHFQQARRVTEEPGFPR
jgi:sulfite reductase beta subunit-like hemoprotein